MTTEKTKNMFGSKFISAIKKHKYLYGMLTPAFVLVVVFCYIPLLGWIMAFVNYRPGISIFKAEWTGLRQFKSFFLEGGDYLYILRNTLVMNVSTIIINLVFAMAFAILLREIALPKLSKFIQTVSFFPFFISWVITYSIVYALFSVSNGAINEFLKNIGAIEESLNILGSPKYSWGLIILLNLWKFTGYNAIIFFATISGIPSEQYQAAGIDGAGRFGKIWHITIPNLIPTFMVLVIINSGWVLQSNFDQFFMFTNSTNWQTMEVFDMYIYKYGLKLLNYPYATAVGMLKSVVSVLIVISVNALSKKINDTSIL